MSDGASKKTVLAPCMGVGKIVASVTRRAAYLIHAQCPEDVELLSIPALLAGDAHERALIRDHPAIIIDGCALRCTAHIFRQFGVDAAAKIEVNQVMKEKKIGPGKTRKELEETGKRLSDFTAEKVLAALNDEGLEARFVAPEELAQDAPEGVGAGCPHSIFSSGGGSSCGSESTESRAAGVPPLLGKHRVTSVTVLPCQGIKRTGGRVTQRAAYEVVEDRFLGKSQVLCISALAAGCQEDVEMLEKFPTVAVNGCAKRCATIAAEYHGIPAVAHVELPDVAPDFSCEEICYEPDPTAKELAMSAKLADATARVVEGLLGSEIDWSPRKVDLHGLVHEPAKLNALTGYKDNGHGILLQLAKEQIGRMENSPTAAKVDVAKSEQEVQAAVMICENPGLKTVMTGLFKPKGKNQDLVGEARSTPA
ncbi:MAG TPA: putative zinc-binding protein [Planctomycetota bacterium]|nr:putative zinc-binding protein [Planctomycetota bacterium]